VAVAVARALLVETAYLTAGPFHTSSRESVEQERLMLLPVQHAQVAVAVALLGRTALAAALAALAVVGMGDQIPQ
jgi:hypothetical protein